MKVVAELEYNIELNEILDKQLPSCVYRDELDWWDCVDYLVIVYCSNGDAVCPRWNSGETVRKVLLREGINWEDIELVVVRHEWGDRGATPREGTWINYYVPKGQNTARALKRLMRDMEEQIPQ